MESLVCSFPRVISSDSGPPSAWYSEIRIEHAAWGEPRASESSDPTARARKPFVTLSSIVERPGDLHGGEPGRACLTTVVDKSLVASHLPPACLPVP